MGSEIEFPDSVGSLVYLEPSTEFGLDLLLVRSPPGLERDDAGAPYVYGISSLGSIFLSFHLYKAVLSYYII